MCVYVVVHLLSPPAISMHSHSHLEICFPIGYFAAYVESHAEGNNVLTFRINARATCREQPFIQHSCGKTLRNTDFHHASRHVSILIDHELEPQIQSVKRLALILKPYHTS